METNRFPVGDATTGEWKPTETFDEFARMCCRQRPHLQLRSDPDYFSLIQRAARIGPVAVSQIVVGSDMSMDCGEWCSTYRILVVQAGRTDTVHKGQAFSAGAGTASVYTPEGTGAARWEAGNRMLCCKIDRHAVNEALGEAVGRSVIANPDFSPVLRITDEPARSWLGMLLQFSEELFCPDSLLSHPLAGMPFAESLVYGFLFAADHSYRDALTKADRAAAPRAVHIAVDIIEEEADQPLTVSSIAARTHVSVRALQLAFQRHLGMPPTTYLRGVRLRRAREDLLRSDPYAVTVSTVAHRWGFSHLGRFSAIYADRYGERPIETLRNARRRNSSRN